MKSSCEKLYTKIEEYSMNDMCIGNMENYERLGLTLDANTEALIELEKYLSHSHYNPYDGKIYLGEDWN